MASNIQPTGLDWKNLPQKTTPISAENLNKMANTIDDLVEAVNPLNTVEANPVGTPTEGLEKVEIDGTLYEVKGGHKILNDSGTTLTQKDNLQFKGVYTQNNGDNTEVDICRTMTKAQMEALSGESLKGFINTSDEPDSLPLTAEWVAYDSNTSVKEKIDEIEDGIEAVGTRTIIQYNGTIINGVSGSAIQGVGSATITLDNGNARIDFNARIITVDSAETFSYGINRDLFTSITGKTITPVDKGIMSFYDSNGALDDLANGYGGTCEILNNMDKFWRPARIYDTSGNIGGWGSLQFAQGMRIVGTVFGTYTE